MLYALDARDANTACYQQGDQADSCMCADCDDGDDIVADTGDGEEKDDDQYRVLHETRQGDLGTSSDGRQESE